MTKTNITDDLRTRLGNCENRQQELLAERSELAFEATVDRTPRAVKRLSEPNAELAALTNESATLEAALAEAHRRETAAEQAAQAEARRQKMTEAEGLCSEAEALAEKLDAGLAAVRQHAADYEATMIKIRRLSGFGPQFDHVRVFLVRSLMTSIERGPMHLNTIAPGDRTTVSQASASWLSNIRAHLAPVLNNKPAAKKAA